MFNDDMFLSLDDGTGFVGFYVDPNVRRSGLGTELLLRLEDAARALELARLVALPWNDASTRFFGSNGFVHVPSSSSNRWIKGLTDDCAELLCKVTPCRGRLGP